VEHDILCVSDAFYKLAAQSLDPHLKKVSQDYIVHYDFAAAIQNVSDGKVVMCESRQFLDFTVRQRLTDKYGQTNMHVMKECLSPLSVAFALQKNSPYTARWAHIGFLAIIL
jgi:hypothetical protein